MKPRILSLLLGATSSAGGAGAVEIIDVNGHAVAVDAQTQVMIDDVPLSPGSALPDKPGVRVEARYATGAAPLGVPAAAAVVFSYAVRGPVTSIVPLRVLGQEVTVTADTQLTGVPGGAIGNVALGDHLDVSGYVDGNASLLASFIEYLPAPTTRWLLSGYVSAVNGDEASIGPQRVSLAGVSPIDCGSGVAAGQYVEIRADAIAGFDATSVLDSVTRLSCVTPMPVGTPGALGALTGIVGVVGGNSFTFGPYTVGYDASTEFRYGSADDLVEGAALEVDGVFGDGGTFAAQGIQFDAPMIRLEGPVDPGDVQAGADGTVTLLGNSVHRAAQLRDEDAIYANGIAQPQQVELRGYLDRLGQRWATRARVRGAPDPADARAGGPVESVARPLLTVLGLSLDTTGATFEDPAGNAIDADAFFAGAVPGALVEQTGAWNGADVLGGGVVALVAPLDPPPADAPRMLIVGTLRGGDALFANGFD
ncbi:MAG TPA: DUF5666 domain-containing protein [Dokdonella sp.]|nr:DUF5666 domain-containing protein [Dokdonella sp.]